MHPQRAFHLALLMLLLGGSVSCQEDETTDCGNIVCPPELSCAPKEQRCVAQDVIDACAEAVEGADCSSRSVEAGICRLGVCTAALCGDGTRDRNEVCDDANTDDGDGCSADCSSDERCGNNIVDEAIGETCDDANTESGDGCSGICKKEECGNGEVDLVNGEVCDDGNTTPGDGCSRDCTSEERCGNGVIDAINGETCDDGNADNGDGCDEDCLVEGCGNGAIEEARGEVCDDGNTENGDGCRADCRKVELCGDGLLDEGEQCDDGNQNPTDACHECQVVEWGISEVLVGGEVQAEGSFMSAPRSAVLDRFGNVYISEAGNHRIRRMSLATGEIETLAGLGLAGISEDGYGRRTILAFPNDIDVDDNLNVYFGESYNDFVRVLDADTKLIERIAGTAFDSGLTADENQATLTDFNNLRGIALDGIGNLYLAEGHKIRVVDSRNNLVDTIIGSGVQGLRGDGTAFLPTNTDLDSPHDVEVTDNGVIYFADTGNNVVRSWDPNGPPWTNRVAGNTTTNFTAGPATASGLGAPQGIAVLDGSVYIADTDNNAVRVVDLSNGTISTLAGTGERGFGGDGGDPTAALLNRPGDVTVDEFGNVVIVDTGNHCIRWIDPATNTIHTIAGTPEVPGRELRTIATAVSIGRTQGIFHADNGDLYLSDVDNASIWRVEPDGAITYAAGTGTEGDAPDGSDPRKTDIAAEGEVLLATNGDLIFTEQGRHRVRYIDATTGLLQTLAGTGTQGYSGNDGPATSAEMNQPWDLAEDSEGRIYIAERMNHIVRRVDRATGNIELIAGTGTAEFTANGVDAATSGLSQPRGIAFDSNDDLFIADGRNHRVRKVDMTNGLIATISGNGSGTHTGNGGPASAATISEPWDLGFDSDDNLFIESRLNHRIRRIDAATGIIERYAGQPFDGNSGDGGPALNAQFTDPRSMAVTPDGTVFVGDDFARIRRIDATTTVITTVAGLRELYPIGSLEYPDVRLAGPSAIAPGDDYTLVGNNLALQIFRQEENDLQIVAGWYNQDTSTGNLARFGNRYFGDILGVVRDEARGVVYFSESAYPQAGVSPDDHAPRDFQRVHVLEMPDPDDLSTWTMTPLIGDLHGFADGDADSAAFGGPWGLHLDGDNLYVADALSHTVRVVDLSNGLENAAVTTLAGRGLVAGFRGDGGPAVGALMNRPASLTKCPSGDLYVSEEENLRVRRIAADGTISTVLGTGASSVFGEGAPSNRLPVATPRGIVCDSNGNVYVASRNTIRLLGANDDGVVDGTGAVTTIFRAEPERGFPEQEMYCLGGLALTDDDTLQVTDTCTGLLLELSRQ